MGLSKLLAKAEELANKELTKLQQQAAAQQQQQQQAGQPGGQQQTGQPYAPPVIITQQPAAAPVGFSTPPPSPPPYSGSVFPGRPSTPPPQPTHAMQQPSPATPAAAGTSPSAAPAQTPSPSSRGRKKALLIACSYPGTKAQLRGPGNDIQCMHYLLTNRFGFSPSQIVVLRDDDYSKGREFIPYRDVIMRACSWLVADAKPGDSLFFHYSGHGGSMKDPTFQEKHDGTLLPTDFKAAGQIRDTELARLMVHPLPPGVILHALFDSCHSGTMLDLPYDTRLEKSGALQNWRRTNMRGTSGGTVIQIGACDDKFTAADTAKLSATAYTGAATYSFIEAVEKYGPQQSYASLLSNMTTTLRTLGKASIKPPSAGSAVASGALPLIGAIALGPLGLLAGCAIGTGMDVSRMQEQVPVLACDRPINLGTALMI